MYQGNYLAERISRASEGPGDALFLTHHDTGQTVTYKAFFANAEQIAAALVRAGVRPGDRVAIQAPKTILMLELYVACVLSGAVFLPLNPAYTPQEVKYFLGDAKPALFVCDPEKQGALAKIAEACGVNTIWTLASNENGSLKDARDAETLGFSAVSREPGDLAAILYTSGTTGRSKGAMLTHRALASNSEVLKDYWHFDASDVLIHALPIFHTHGLFVATNITLMAGGSMIFMPRFDAEKILETMPRATALMGVPTFYTRLLECDGLQGAAHNMRLFVSGSAPLLAETHDRWRAETSHEILERYGMTETNMNTSNPYDGARRAGTVGFPLPGVELKITDHETGTPLGVNEIGILEVRGDNVFSGYWQMPEKTAEELRENGFFITGDLGKIDEDGYVHIVGRSKDLIITGGFNVYPKEVETLIDDLPGVVESAVIGVPHPDFGEAVVAIVVPEDGSLETAAISNALSDSLAKFKQPRKIIQVDALPRNTMGKVQKADLRKTYGTLFT
ncbi:malonyl-CoA synthase [Pseudohalocynthiibacter sp. F2068]|uniref:malonate--CoA ligase n=1 Tax=Pseudohalocynthiibacter sp. F2068 TaxID=2926418 RepID=UPI001FF4F17A|nr:malonyl-CoA synthase [Pseudohalocynthiibacter sp. F2068]MCK0103010.1 malonyl-CoA synthase [Pseudohalocynthiibacter sp. F2068]